MTNYVKTTPKDIKKYIYSFLSYEDKRNTYKILDSRKPKRPTIKLDSIKELYQSIITGKVLPRDLEHYNENWYINTYDSKNVIDSLSKILMIKYATKTNTKIFVKCKYCDEFLRIPFIHNGWDSDGDLIMSIKFHYHSSDNTHYEYLKRITIEHNSLIKDIEESDRKDIMEDIDETFLYRSDKYLRHDREFF